MYPASMGTSGRGNYALRVEDVTNDSVILKAVFPITSGGEPVTSKTVYRCQGGVLLAQGYVNMGDLTSHLGRNQDRFVVTTDRASGEFLPQHIDIGSVWSSSFDVTITPRIQAVEENDTPMRPMSMSVTIERGAIVKERVTVPAGTYDALKVRTTTSFDGQVVMNGTEWWVKDVGMVKSTYNAGTASGAQDIVTEAMSVTVPRN